MTASKLVTLSSYNFTVHVDAWVVEAFGGEVATLSTLIGWYNDAKESRAFSPLDEALHDLIEEARAIKDNDLKALEEMGCSFSKRVAQAV